MKYLLVLILGILISNTAEIYANKRVSYWFESHKPSQGMPDSLDLNVAELISRPINYFIDCD